MFKKPIYCESLAPGKMQCCNEGDYACNLIICQKYSDSIREHVLPERTLTYNFGLFCERDETRIMLKVFVDRTLDPALNFVIYRLYYIW